MMKTRTSNLCYTYGPYICLILVLLLVGFAHQVSLAFAALEDKEYIAGVPANFPPYYYTDVKTGKPYGFAIDVMDEVARRSRVKITYVVFENFSDAIVALQRGEIDLIPNLGITQERQNYTDFTAPLETFHIHIFVRSTTDDIHNIDDLAGRKVAVVAENRGYYIMKDRSGVELLVYNSMEEAFMSLISGNCDAMIYSDPVLILFARQSGLEDRIKPTGDALAEIKRSIGVRKGQPDLYNKLDETVKAFILTPEYERIYSKWYGEPPVYWNTQKVLVALGLTVAFIAAIFSIFHYFSVLRLNKKLADSMTLVKKNQQLFQSILDNTPSIVFIKDMEGRYILFNRQWEKLFNPDKKNLQDKTDYEIFPPDLAGKLRANDLMVIESQTSMDFEESAQISDGTIHTYLSTKSPILDETGKIFAMCGISTDITQRKQEEDALQAALQKREELEFIVNNSQVMVFLWRNEQGWPVEFVSGNITQFGYTPEDFMKGRIHYADMIHSGDLERVGNEVIMYSEQGATEFRQQYRIITKSGDIRWTDDITWIRRDKNGNITHYQGIVMDITQRKQAEEELKKYRENLEELVNKRTAELNTKNEELERFNKLFVGRELRMIELKKKIAELEKKTGSPENAKGK